MTVVVADTGALISLSLIGKIDLIEKVFGEFCICQAVWEELNNYQNPDFDRELLINLESKVVPLKSRNHLSLIMDYGESESVILYDELEANYLLIDDNKAREIAESLEVNCIGTIGLLILAKRLNLINSLKPLFEKFLSADRYFSKNFLNRILNEVGEDGLE